MGSLKVDIDLMIAKLKQLGRRCALMLVLVSFFHKYRFVSSEKFESGEQSVGIVIFKN